MAGNAYNSVSTRAANSSIPQFQNPINWGTISANVGATAQTPGAPQSANAGIGDLINGAQGATKLYDWLNTGASTANTAATTTSEFAKGLGTSGSESLGISGLNTPSGGLDFIDGGDLTGSLGDFGDTFSLGGNNSFSLSDTLGISKNMFGPEAFGGGDSLFGSLGSTGLDSIGSGLASAGAGFLGNTLGGWIGGGGGYSNVGGTVGGIAGAYFGGPIGSFVGSTLGNIVGGLFGGGTPHPVSESAFTNINPNGTFGSIEYGAKHIPESIAKSGAGDFQSYLQSQAKKFGVQYKGDINGRVDYTPDQGKIVLSPGYDYTSAYNASLSGASNDKSQIFTFDPKDKASRDTAYQNAFNYLATNSGYDPNALTPAQAQSQVASVVIPRNNEPSDWDKFLADYKTSHGQ